MVTPIDCSATTFDLSHEGDDDESDAGVSTSSMRVAVPGDGGGVSAFIRWPIHETLNIERSDAPQANQCQSRRTAVWTVLSIGVDKGRWK
jgi:hypothetical protein